MTGLGETAKTQNLLSTIKEIFMSHDGQLFEQTPYLEKEENFAFKIVCKARRQVAATTNIRQLIPQK